MRIKSLLALVGAGGLAVLAMTGALVQQERRARHAEAKVVKIEGERRAETIRGTTNAAVAEAVEQTAAVQTRTERVVQTIIREVEKSPDAATPIPPDLARSWVAGLRGLCDQSPGACADPPDRAHPLIDRQSVSPGDASRK